MMNQIKYLILFQLKEYLRNPAILFWSFGFPVLIAWVLGAAFGEKQIQKFTIGVESQSIVNRLIVEHKDKYEVEKQELRLNKGGKTEVYKFIIAHKDDLVTLMKSGKVSLIISSKSSIKYHFDQSNKEAEYAYLKLKSLSFETMLDQSEIKPVTQIGNRYIDFLIPGLIALGIMNSAMWGISYYLIELRVKKLMRRMIASPMSKHALMIAVTFSRLVLSSVEALILLVFSILFFGIELQGSLLALILIFISGNFCFYGIAILVSSKTSNTRIGTGLINMVTMPMLVCSGIFFTYSNFPDFIIPIIQYMPLTLLADGIRAVFTEGAGITDSITVILLLSFYGVVFYFPALRIFKWY